MKPSVISAEALFEEHRPILRWEWIAGHAHPERQRRRPDAGEQQPPLGRAHGAERGDHHQGAVACGEGALHREDR